MTSWGAVDFMFDQLRCIIGNRGHILPPMSIEQMKDCTQAEQPSGYLFGAYLAYAVKNGLEMETFYPATASPKTCHFNPRFVQVTIASLGGTPGTSEGLKGNETVLKGNETALALALEATPVQAILKVGADFLSKGITGGLKGILTSCGTSLVGAQAMQVVAHGVSGKGQAFWTAKLPFGSTFGDNGYIHIAKDAGNTCGVADDWIYPVGVKYCAQPPCV